MFIANLLFRLDGNALPVFRFLAVHMNSPAALTSWAAGEIKDRSARLIGVACC